MRSQRSELGQDKRHRIRLSGSGPSATRGLATRTSEWVPPSVVDASSHWRASLPVAADDLGLRDHLVTGDEGQSEAACRGHDQAVERITQGDGSRFVDVLWQERL